MLGVLNLDSEMVWRLFIKQSKNIKASLIEPVKAVNVNFKQQSKQE